MISSLKKARDKRSMRILLIICMVFVGITLVKFIFDAQKTEAAVGINRQINFQGKLTNPDGTNVTDGTYSIRFTLYDDATSGTNLWQDTYSLSVVDGIFRATLGSGSVLLPTSLDFNTDSLYLGIKVGSDDEMTPRVRFTGVPYAFNAEKVSGLTVTSTTGTLTIPNAKTIAFADAFTTSGAFPLTLTTTSSTNVTLPTSGVLATLAGTETFTNKTLTESLLQSSLRTGTGLISVDNDYVEGIGTLFTSEIEIGDVIHVDGYKMYVNNISDDFELSAEPHGNDYPSIYPHTTYQIEKPITRFNTASGTTVSMISALGNFIYGAPSLSTMAPISIVSSIDFTGAYIDVSSVSASSGLISRGGMLGIQASSKNTSYNRAVQSNSTGANGYDFYGGNSLGMNYFAGKVGIGVTTPTNALELNSNRSDNATDIYAFRETLNITGTPVTTRANDLRVYQNATTGTITNFEGQYVQLTVSNIGGATYAKNYASWGTLTGSGNVSEWSHFAASNLSDSGSGNIGTQYGVKIETLTSGLDNWGVYVGDTKSYFGGAIGIGASPANSAKLYVRDADNDVTANIAQFFANNLSNGLGFGGNRIDAIGSATNQDIYIYPKGTGHVGIGTNSNVPTSKLAVQDSIAIIPSDVGQTAYPYFQSVRRGSSAAQADMRLVSAGQTSWIAHGLSMGIGGDYDWNYTLRVRGTLFVDDVLTANSTLLVSGNADFTGGSGTLYSSASIEIRTTETPRIAFHWPGVVAAQLGINSSGLVRTYNNPGTDYAPFGASDFYTNGTKILGSSTHSEIYAGSSGWLQLKSSANAHAMYLGGSGNLRLYQYLYPGRADTSGGDQTTWYLASHGSYGLYTNTNFFTNGYLQATNNSYVRVGNAYFSSGNTMMAIANNEYYNGTSWVGNGTAGGLIQISGLKFSFYQHNGSGTHSEVFRVENTGSTFLRIQGTSTQRMCHGGADGNNGATMLIVNDCSSGGADIAELYATTDTTLAAQDIVMLDTSKSIVEYVHEIHGYASKVWVKKATQAESRKLLGVYSTNPFSEVLGEGTFLPEDNAKPIALTGRVPVKVNTSNGDIQAGDFITISSTAGVGMKATDPGMVIGKALEGYSNSDPSVTGSIVVFVNLTYYNPHQTAGSWLLNDDTLETAYSLAVTGDITASQATFTSVYTELLNINNGNLTIDSAGKLTTTGGIVTNSLISASLTATDASIDTLKVRKLLVDRLPSTGDPVIGKATLLTGTQKITVTNNNITPNASIFITSLTKGSPTLSVTQKISGMSFDVESEFPVSKDIEFEYWIVGE